MILLKYEEHSSIIQNKKERKEEIFFIFFNHIHERCTIIMNRKGGE